MSEVPEGWDVKSLDEISIKIRTGPFGSQLREDRLSKTGIKVYTQDNVLKNDFNIGNMYIPPSYLRYFVDMEVRPGDILVTIRGTVGKAAVVPQNVERGIIHTNLALIRPNTKIVAPDYLKTLINDSDILIKQISSMFSSTTIPALYTWILKQLELPLPPLPEQRKIAEVLSKVDSLLERTEKIIEKYERIKRGLAQDLLTRGIDENGRIRSEETHEFKDSPIGRIPKEWKAIMLGKITNYHKGTKPVPGQPAVPYLDANGLRTRKFTVTSKKSASVIAEKGDILLIWDGSNSGEFFKSPITGAVASTMVRITPTDKNVDTDYLYYVLKFKIEPHLRDSIQGTGIPHVSKYELENSIVLLPPLPEQRRIAQVLSQVDSILDKERRELEKLKRLKRGLMNDLLSGKVRVTPLLEGDR